MISANDVTFIVPIYKLGIDRLNNLKFILPHIIKTGARVLVVEQVKESATSLDLKEFNSEHLLYVSKSEEFHKTGIINWAVRNHANTKYVWVNDVDFYMKFGNVFGVEWTEDFIKPYSTGKKLTSDDSTRILRGEKIDVSYEDESAEYISLYSALSFIFNKEAFLSIGGMDESLFGWGKEDIEFSERVKSKNIPIQEIDHKGIHLYHPVGGDIVADVITNTQTTLVEKDMAIITCYFNWCGFISPTRNFNRFLRQMDILGYPVYGVELSLNDRFETTGRVGWKQIRVDKKNICFQKEACINLAEKLVPKKYKKIAWIDPDFSFTNTNWYNDTSKKLDTFKLVQMYDKGIGTDRFGRIDRIHPSLMSMHGKVSMVDWYHHPGHPGGAWGANRNLWKWGGLYPYAIMGGGDTVFIYTIFGFDFSGASYEHLNIGENSTFLEYINWKKKIMSYIKPEDVSYISGSFIHEWHGDRDNRGYNTRHKILERIDLNTNVILNNNRIIELRGISKRSTYDQILGYFENRDEDAFLSDWKKYLTFRKKESLQ
jgi:hypothetical protein